MHRLASAISTALLLAAPGAADVQVVGVTTGVSAVVVIDGGGPIELEIGEEFDGVEVVRTSRNGAVLRIDGVERSFPLVSYRGSAPVQSTTITLTAQGAHFYAAGAINGSPMRFLVDTGATRIALSRSLADRIGVYYEGEPRVTSRTANGLVGGWLVVLDSVRIEDVIVDEIHAVVIDNDGMGDMALLGMNFLDYFDMQRRGETLVLRRRQ